tara:strand:- start:313 stop:477 length:165 start_codon:yes stop_codon:yes gene_type:complete
MIYLKNLNGIVREFKDGDTSTVDSLIDSGRWERIAGRKDWSPYNEKKKASKKAK